MIERLVNGKKIMEPAREIDVFQETDVLVVGGGPAGATAAIAAAREGADTILVERYGHLGGMATGGLVLMINQFPPGQCQEWMDKLEALGGARDISKTKEPSFLKHSMMVDPELLKCIINDMADEAGVKQLLHSWGTQAIVENETVKGVIFESKSGRQAVLSKITIDATGDGDIFASAGAEFDGSMDHGYRSSNLALVFRVGNIDFDKFAEFRATESDKWEEMRTVLNGIAGFRVGPVAGSRSDVVWINSFIKGLNPLKVEDLTRVEISVRKVMIPVHEYLVKTVPGFEKSFIYDSASQIGTRGSRRLIGEYVFTREDAKSRKQFEDTVAIFPQGVPLSFVPEKMPEDVGLPYRSLLPAGIDGILAAGRCFSSDPAANTMFNVIPHCISMGQAAGTAAALAVKNNISPKNVEYRKLHERLTAQGITLPAIN